MNWTTPQLREELEVLDDFGQRHRLEFRAHRSANLREAAFAIGQIQCLVGGIRPAARQWQLFLEVLIAGLLHQPPAAVLRPKQVHRTTQSGSPLGNQLAIIVVGRIALQAAGGDSQHRCPGRRIGVDSSQAHLPRRRHIRDKRPLLRLKVLGICQ